MRDVSGMMYRRNRYYGPNTGQFTQIDPIGIAGGLNVYGYGSGDPVTYDDPFGLKIVCRTRLACQVYNRMLRRAQAAANSDNEQRREQARQFLARLHRIDSSEAVVGIYAANANPLIRFLDGWGAIRPPLNASAPCSHDDGRACRPGGYGVQIDPGWSRFASVSGEVRLAHELGHIWALLEGLGSKNANNDRASIEMENMYRAAVGCGLRPNSHQDSGPSCSW